MELLLELVIPSGEGAASMDVAVDVNPSDTVSQLTDALMAYAEGNGLGPLPGRPKLVVGPSARVLRSAETVLEADLVSGQSVALRFGSMPQAADTGRGVYGGVSLDIASGPEAGRFVILPPGVYTVGRSQDCAVTIDDPTVSRHHLTVKVGDDLTVTVIPNPEASNGTFVSTEAVLRELAVRPDELVQAGATALAFRPRGPDVPPERDLLGQIPFNRVPYRRTLVPRKSFEPLAAPPERRKARGFPVLAAVLPVLAGVGIALISRSPHFLLIMLLSPLMLIGRWVSDRRGGSKWYATERAQFTERLEGRIGEVRAALEEERRKRLLAAPDVAELARRAHYRQSSLWERDRDSPDFLSLRLGLGALESQVEAKLDRGGDPELRQMAEERLAEQAVVYDVPVTVSLAELKVMGLFGEEAAVTGVAAASLMQAACLHSPEDLVIAAALPEQGTQDFGWLKWLPHTRASTSPLEGAHLRIGAEEGRQLLGKLREVVTDRLERRPGSTATTEWPKVLVVIHEDADLDRAVLSQLLDAVGDVGIVVLWLGHSAFQVPRQCQATLECADPLADVRSRLRFRDPEREDRELYIESVRPSTALGIARTLAPLRDASAATLTTAIPRQVLLLDALGMEKPEAGDLARRWASPHPYGLRAPLGQAADGTFSLDLVADGPHALIAGTSGSGKSELLQTLVASLAAIYSPQRLNFLFIDYKGGASSASFRELPHAVGYVTNLDARLSLRALTSLRAELSRRMAVLEGRARDLKEMLAIAPDEAPPSLVLVVDEFATLVKEIPDFVAGIVDIAQRGRSLGIHLVLATQRPAGAVNDNILANTNLRIALRVVDPLDSMSVIGSKEAADIPVPLRGRAYARMGPQQLIAFQCAWSGAEFSPEKAAHTISVRSFALGELTVMAAQPPRRQPVLRRGAHGRSRRRRRRPISATTSVRAPTQLEVVVAAAAQAAADLSLPAPRRPWTAPLPELIPLDDVLAQLDSESFADAGHLVPLGLLDDPESQAQQPAIIDLEAGGGLLVFGTGGAGKTSTLRTIAASLAQQGDADSMQLYGLDFGSRALHQLAALPQCAGVATGDDPERVTRILTLLSNEVARRRPLLAATQTETLSALRSLRGEPVVPRLVLLLNGYSGFQAAFDKADTYEWITLFQRLVTEGRQVGIHAVITTDRRGSIPSSLFSATSTRLVLRLTDPEEMALLGVPVKVAKGAELVAGRGFLGSTEVQVACVSEDPAGASQAEALTKLGARLEGDSSARAPALPELPERVDLDQLGTPTAALRVPFAVADLTLEPVEVNLVRGNFLVTGPPQSGKSVALATVAEAIRRAADHLQLVGIGGAGSPLSELALWDEAAFERRKQAALLDDLLGRLEPLEGSDVQALVVVDEAGDIDDSLARPLERLTRLDAVRLAVAVEPAMLARGFSGWLGTLRRNRRLLLLQPEGRSEVEQLGGVKARFRPAQSFPPGRGVFIADRRWNIVQVARPGSLGQ